MKIDGEVYYTTDELATYFEVKEATVRQWVSRGELKCSRKVRIGRNDSSLYSEADVRAFAQKRYGS